MKLTIENTENLTSREFIELLSIELFNSDNNYLLTKPQVQDIPEYFYISAYLLEFDTEFQMQGLLTTLTNFTAYNFMNTLNSCRKINNIELTECLEGIFECLQKYDLTPVKFRENWIEPSQETYLFEELRAFDKKLWKLLPKLWEDLENYLKEVRKK